LSNYNRIYRSDDRGKMWFLPWNPPAPRSSTPPDYKDWDRSGGAQDIAVAPNGVLYSVGSDWVRSDDGGKTWRILTKPTSGNASSVAIPDTATILVGTDQGIFRSSDEGRSWRNVYPVDRVCQIAVHPRNKNLVFAVSLIHSSALLEDNTYKQLPWVLRSTDAGRTWSAVGDFRADMALAIALDPVDTKVLYCTSNSGLYKSVDTGVHWSKVPADRGIEIGSGALAVDPASRNTLYAMTADGPAVSKDEGTHWTLLPASAGRGISAIAVSDKAVSFATDMAISRSTNHGKSWEATISGLPHAGIVDAAVDYSAPGGLYACGDHYLYHSADRGKTWTQTGTDAKRIMTFAEYPNTIVVFAADKVQTSRDAGRTWVSYELPKVAENHEFAVDPRSPNKMYSGDGRYILSTEDSGEHWTRHQVFSSSVSNLGISSISVSPSNGTVFAGTVLMGVAFDSLGGKRPSHTVESVHVATYNSSDNGNTWKAMPESGDITHENDYISILTADPKNPDTLYAGGISGIRRSTFLKSLNGGISWSYWNDSPVYDWIRSITVDPQNTRRIYVGTFSEGVFVSADGGNSWAKSSEGLPPVPPSSGVCLLTVTLDAKEPGHVYAVTEAGLFTREF
jgi:photosystem II stability/assembly factor-like uncharacterized protein